MELLEVYSQFFKKKFLEDFYSDEFGSTSDKNLRVGSEFNTIRS